MVEWPSPEQHRGAVEIVEAAEALILSRKVWERWGDGSFLYDRLKGHGEGTVYTTADALRKIAGGR
jgi:hypothetical protein